MSELIPEMFQQMEWADDRMWKAVPSCPAAGDDARLRTLLVHLHTVQRAFLHIWQEIPIDAPEESSFADLEAIEAWGRENHVRLGAYLADAGNHDFDRKIAIPWTERLEQRIGRPVVPATLGETMIQVVMHSMYHRGQVNARLRELGGEPPLVDFIAWVWMGKGHE